MTSVTSSAPARPRLERRSDIAVNPEMSTKARVPSTSCHVISALSRSQSSVSRGTNDTSSADAAGSTRSCSDIRRYLPRSKEEGSTGRPSDDRGLDGAVERTGYPNDVSVTDALGRPLHDLRISVTDRCNFRCVY